jgi:hypothetical protein
MTQTNITTAGIDTSKLNLDIAVHGRTERWQVANALPGWRTLAANLAKIGVTRVGIEATGGYPPRLWPRCRAVQGPCGPVCSDPRELERLRISSVACGTGETAMTTEKRETVSLIGSDKVQGTAVFSPDGEKIGSIERVMIEKTSGKVSYAVLSFGGFLGFGDDYYPLPWPSLKYNVDLGGYQTMVPIQKLKSAPKYARNASWDWDSGDRALDDYYGVVPT